MNDYKILNISCVALALIHSICGTRPMFQGNLAQAGLFKETTAECDHGWWGSILMEADWQQTKERSDLIGGSRKA